MRFSRKKKSNVNSLNKNCQRDEETESSMNKETVLSELSELELFTRKHSSLVPKRNLSMNRSKKEKKIVTFTAVIDSIDGIIATNSGRQSLISQRNQPIFAVISYYKKVVATGRTVKTNLLSLPLMKSNSSIGKRERFYAKFLDENQPQSFSLSAAMRIDQSYKSGFEPRELDFEVSLMRGSEVIKLGSSTLILNGNEVGIAQLATVDSSKSVTNTVRKAMTANKPNKTSVSNVSTTGVKMVSFANDPTYKYSLQRATMRLAVHVQSANNKTQSQYLSNESYVPSSMMLSIGNSDSVSCLSSGGVTSDIFKESQTNRKASSDTMTKGFRKLHTLNTTSTDMNFSFSMNEASAKDNITLDESTVSKNIEMRNNCFSDGLLILESNSTISGSAENTDDSTQIKSLSFDDGIRSARTTFSDDESALLDEVSIGTIKFKGIESSNGFEVVSLNQQNTVLRTESDILG